MLWAYLVNGWKSDFQEILIIRKYGFIDLYVYFIALCLVLSDFCFFFTLCLVKPNFCDEFYLCSLNPPPPGGQKNKKRKELREKKVSVISVCPCRNYCRTAFCDFRVYVKLFGFMKSFLLKYWWLKHVKVEAGSKTKWKHRLLSIIYFPPELQSLFAWTLIKRVASFLLYTEKPLCF